MRLVTVIGAVTPTEVDGEIRQMSACVHKALLTTMTYSCTCQAIPLLVLRKYNCPREISKAFQNRKRIKSEVES